VGFGQGLSLSELLLVGGFACALSRFSRRAPLRLYQLPVLYELCTPVQNCGGQHIVENLVSLRRGDAAQHALRAQLAQHRPHLLGWPFGQGNKLLSLISDLGALGSDQVTKGGRADFLLLSRETTNHAVQVSLNDLLGAS